MAGNRYVTFIVLSCLFCRSACSNFQEESAFDLSGLDVNSSIICNLVNCVKGKCVNSSSFPLYQCQCDEGWQSPFGASWLPCVLPNCSLNLGCSNTSSAAAPPATTPSSAVGVCSVSVCGNGECTPESNSNATYECKCNPGYINLFNKTDGYCLRECALGADCTNLNIPISGSSNPPPPPAPVPSSQNSNQGTKLASLSRLMIMWATLASVGLGL